MKTADEKAYLLIIPARGGSKGIPDKNILEVGGKPLIAYSVAVANAFVQAHPGSVAVVSTDSPRIAEVARQHGGNVPFLRPESIADDKAKSVGFMLHAVEWYEKEGHSFDAVIVLQPTSPLRTLEDVESAVAVYRQSGADSLISAYQEDYICELVCYHQNGDMAQPLSPLHNAGVRRQEHEKLFVRNGAVYITAIPYLKASEKVIADTPALYVMPRERSVNLDTLDDLERLRWILR